MAFDHQLQRVALVKLLSANLSMFGAKVEIALREKAVNFELEMVPYNPKNGYSPKHPDVVRINPKRQVPVLIDNDVEIFDSTQIFEYAEDRWPSPPLWPAAPAERARARQLEHASDEVFFPHVIRLMGLRANPDPVDSPDWIKARSEINDYYAKVESVLSGRDYLAGAFSYADIAFYMAQFFAARHTVPMTAHHPQLLQWRGRMAARSSVQIVIGRMADYLRSIGRPVPDYR
jgi:glutathione S-transferase